MIENIDFAFDSYNTLTANTEKSNKHFISKHICYGLCSESTMSKLLKNNLTTNKLLIDALMERTGYPNKKITYYLTQKEYNFLFMRYQISEALKLGNYTKLQSLLWDYYKKTKKEHYYKLHKQFITKYIAILLYIYRKDFLATKKLLLNSIHLTCPDYKKVNPSNHYFCLEELEIIFLLAINDARMGLQETAIQSLENILYYLDTLCFDDYYKSKIYPQVAYQLILLLQNDIKKETYMLKSLDLSKNHTILLTNKRFYTFDKILDLCNKVTALQKRTGNLFLLPNIQLIATTITNQKYNHNTTKHTDFNFKNMKYINKQANYFNILTNHYFCSKPKSLILDGIFCLKMVNLFPAQNILIIGNTIKKNRIALGLSQEKLAFDICDKKTLWKIEQNVHTPHSHIITSLLKKLGRYHIIPSFILSELNIQELSDSIKLDIISKNFFSAKLKFKDLKSQENKQTTYFIENKQYLDYLHILLDNMPNTKYNLDYISSLEKVLQYTIPYYPNLDLRCFSLSTCETLILNEIANTYDQMNQPNEALNILYSLIDHTTLYDTDLCFDIETECISRINLSNCLIKQNQFDIANTILDDGIKYSIKYNYGRSIPRFLYQKATIILKQMENKKIYNYYIQQALYFSDIFNDLILYHEILDSIKINE